MTEVAKEEKKSPMKRQETIKRSKAEQREDFSDAEVDSLKKSASRMQVNAEFGFL